MAKVSKHVTIEKELIDYFEELRKDSGIISSLAHAIDLALKNLKKRIDNNLNLVFDVESER